MKDVAPEYMVVDTVANLWRQREQRRCSGVESGARRRSVRRTAVTTKTLDTDSALFAAGDLFRFNSVVILAGPLGGAPFGQFLRCLRHGQQHFLAIIFIMFRRSRCLRLGPEMI